jgi:hypothetical protein
MAIGALGMYTDPQLQRLVEVELHRKVDGNEIPT